MLRLHNVGLTPGIEQKTLLSKSIFMFSGLHKIYFENNRFCFTLQA